MCKGRMENYISYIWAMVLGLFAFSIVTTASNALYNSCLALTIVVGLIHCYVQRDWQWPPKIILWSGAIFFLSFLASLMGHHEGKVLSRTLSYVSWSFPFWSMYYWGRYKVYRGGIILGLGLGLLAISYMAYSMPTDLGRWTGNFASPNLLAMVISMVLPLFILRLFRKLKHKRDMLVRFVELFLSLIGLYVMVKTESRGVLIGFSAGVYVTLILVVLRQYGKWSLSYILAISGMSIGLLGLAYYGYQEAWIAGLKRPYDGERLLLWQSSIAMWKDYPWLGIGFGHWNDVYLHGGYISPLAKEPNLPHSHNTFLYILSSTGLVGAMGYLVFCFAQVKEFVSQYRKNGNIYILAMFWVCVALIVEGIVDIGLVHRFGMYVYFAVLGLSIASVRRKDGESYETM